MPARRKYATEEERKVARNIRQRERYAADPEYRAKVNASNNLNAKANHVPTGRPPGRPRTYEYSSEEERKSGENARHRERYASDPEYREKHLAGNRGKKWVLSPAQKMRKLVLRKAKASPETRAKHAAREALRRASETQEEREARLEAHNAWSDANRESKNAKEKARRAAMSPAQKSALYASMHNARTRAGGTMTEFVVSKVLSVDVCHYCEVPISRDLPLVHPRRATVDHKVPVSRGGTHSIYNLVAACRRCNTKKCAKPYEMYMSTISHSAGH